jgi:hypothetical protein
LIIILCNIYGLDELTEVGDLDGGVVGFATCAGVDEEGGVGGGEEFDVDVGVFGEYVVVFFEEECGGC